MHNSKGFGLEEARLETQHPQVASALNCACACMCYSYLLCSVTLLLEIAHLQQAGHSLCQHIFHSRIHAVFNLVRGKKITITVLSANHFKMHTKDKYHHCNILYICLSHPHSILVTYNGGVNSLCVGGPTLHLAPHPNTSGNNSCAV